MTPAQRNSACLHIVLAALSPMALAALVASCVWSVHEMAAGAPWRLVGLTPSPCPGCAMCGMSRAFTALSHGQLVDALRFHPGVVVLYPAFCVLAVAGPVIALRWLASRRLRCRPLLS